MGSLVLLSHLLSDLRSLNCQKLYPFCHFLLISAKNLRLLQQLMYMHLKVLISLFQKMVLVIILWIRIQKILVFEVDGFYYISAESILFLIFYSLAYHELLISRTPIKTTIFWKSMMRSFRWIEITCFNIFRFLAEVSTNVQKLHHFGQFKRTITQERIKEITQMTHFFQLLIFIFCV